MINLRVRFRSILSLLLLTQCAYGLNFLGKHSTMYRYKLFCTLYGTMLCLRFLPAVILDATEKLTPKNRFVEGSIVLLHGVKQVVNSKIKH